MKRNFAESADPSAVLQQARRFPHEDEPLKYIFKSVDLNVYKL